MSPALVGYQDGFEHRGVAARGKVAGHRISANDKADEASKSDEDL
jgi:hypothetical protein